MELLVLLWLLYSLFLKSNQWTQQTIDQTLNIHRGANTTIITVGYIAGYSVKPGSDQTFPRTSRYVSGALSYAIYNINTMAQNPQLGNESALPYGYQLNLYFVDTYNDRRKSIRAMVNMSISTNIWAIFGAQEGCQSEADIASGYNRFFISYYCTDDISQDNNYRFLTFVRTSPQVSGLSDAITEFLLTFHWKNVALVNTDDKQFSYVRDSALDSFKLHNITVLDRETLKHPAIYGSDSGSFKVFLERSYKNTRIFVFIGHDYEAMGFIRTMVDLDIFNKGDYFVVVGLLRRQHLNPKSNWSFYDNYNRIHWYFNNVAFVLPTEPKKEAVKHLQKKIFEFNNKPPFHSGFKDRKIFLDDRYIGNLDTGYLYDAVMLYAQALGALIRNGNFSQSMKGDLIKSQLTSQNYQSIFGYNSRINSRGEAIGNFTAIQISRMRSQRTFILKYLGNFWPSKYSKDQMKFMFNENRRIHWLNDRKPLDIPSCGFSGELCNRTYSKSSVIVPVICFVFILGFIGLLLKIRYDKNERELERLIWKVNPGDIDYDQEKEMMIKLLFVKSPPIEFVEADLTNANNENDCRVQLLCPEMSGESNKLIHNSCFNLDQMINRMTNEHGNKFINFRLGKHRNQEVIIKSFILNQTDFNLSRDIKKELKTLKEISHINLNKYLGAIIDTHNHKIFNVWELCDHGSLQDVLYGTTLTTDHPVFVSSFSYDLISGLTFIHEHPSIQPYHCNLKSSNCLIDTRWTLRLSDFGTDQLLKHAYQDEKPRYLQYLSLFWTAPEILRLILTNNLYSTCPFRDNHSEYHDSLFTKEINKLSNQQYSISNNNHKIEETVSLFSSPHFKTSSSTAASPAVTYKLHLSHFYTYYNESSNKNKRNIHKSSSFYRKLAQQTLDINITNSYNKDINKLDNLFYQRADIYSFALVFYEIHSCQLPFFIDYISQKSPEEIIRRIVVLNDEFKVPYRPKLSLLSRTDQKVTELIKNCWHENPSQRMNVKSITNKFKSIFGEKINLVECMKEKMSLYTKNLEMEVMRRTEELREEKKQNEELLYQMLPVSVAEQLRQKKQVEAEAFDCVSIYFSDIVGFTELAATLSPFEVVNLLNRLYTLFDNIIENYTVYKVETIGDSYMVVSGLPTPFNEHALEMADMSLRLLEEITKGFVIPSKKYQNERLKLRIGLHSGPCCAGVVGTRNPRYCLFGDTVNMASRMESTGEACKIHCSEAFQHQLIEKSNDYIIIPRGITQVKGKGSVNTFWLLGKSSVIDISSAEEDITKKSSVHASVENIPNQSSNNFSVFKN